jgi:pyruvate formate lyase activating enzyme
LAAIKGLEKFAPKDYPGFMAATVFLGSCNFRCPYCHNADLVLHPQSLSTYPLDYFMSFLDSRRDWLEGVCVTGGEPLIHKDLAGLLSLIKERDLLIKVDTNGSFPSRLEQLIRGGLIDAVAMDVKAPLEKYQEVTQSSVEPESIRRSISIIIDSDLDYVFRTTVVPGLVGGEEIKRIAQLLEGAEIFQIQQFVPKNTLDPDYSKKKPFPPEKIHEFARSAQEFFSEVRIEGA